VRWLAVSGHRVFGVELSGVAIDQLFHEFQLPRTTWQPPAPRGVHRVHTCGNIGVVEVRASPSLGGGGWALLSCRGSVERGDGCMGDGASGQHLLATVRERERHAAAVALHPPGDARFAPRPAAGAIEHNTPRCAHNCVYVAYAHLTPTGEVSCHEPSAVAQPGAGGCRVGPRCHGGHRAHAPTRVRGAAVVNGSTRRPHPAGTCYVRESSGRAGWGNS
jgi:hypothetical protein